jgi:hydroxymethylpyrimidine/phosphomethylpyrimidine kinase
VSLFELVADATAVPSDDSGGTGGTFDISVLAQYGVLGIFAILLIVFANTSYRREITRADRLEAEVLRLNQLIQEKHIPALESAAHALREANEVMRDFQRANRRQD